MKTIKVFISYAWEDADFAQKILSFSNKLRACGIDASIDQYEENPDMGWPMWMENQIETSDFVLVVSTKTYLQKFIQYKSGKGVSWEISSIYQSLYNLRGHNNKFIPIIFDSADTEYIVKGLQPYTFYNVSENFSKLENRLKGIPNTNKPPIKQMPLSIKQRKSIFVTTPINIKLWDSAKWSGVSFIYCKNIYFLGLVFKGSIESSLKIFEEWQRYPNLDHYIDFKFIEGEIEKLPPNGYTCLIAPNIEKAFERSKSFFNYDDEKLILAVNRFQRMYPTDNFAYFNFFKKLVLDNKGIQIPIIPVTLKNTCADITVDNIIPHFDKMVHTANIKYILAKDIRKTDMESCVIPLFNEDFPIDNKK